MNISNFKNMDVNMLYSIINMKLRDEFDSLEELCNYFDISREELEEKLKSGGYKYHSGGNQFK